MDLMQPSGTPSAELDQFARDWADGVLVTSPFTDAERATVIDAVRRCYEHAGLPWPDRVFWAPSPAAAQFLANDLARRHTAVTVRVRTMARVILRWTASLVAFGLAGVLGCVVLALMLLALLPGDSLLAHLDAKMGLHNWRGAWIGGVVAALLVVAVLVGLCWANARDGADTFGRSLGSNVGLVAFVLWTAFMVVLLGCMIGRGAGGIAAAGGPPTWTWIRTLLTATLGPAVVVIAVLGAVLRNDGDGSRLVQDPAYDRLHRCLDQVLAAIGDAGPAGWSPLGQGFAAELSEAVGRSVDVDLASVRRGFGGWRRPLEYQVRPFGSWRAGAARPARDTVPMPADAGVVGDFDVVSRGGWWWPHTRFVVIGERPSTLRVDSGRLHCTDGPAVEWSDGHRIHALHGTVVPAGLIEHGWDVQQIHSHPNSEVRRAAIERMGWVTYIERAGWRLVATAPDPGNAPHELALYADPNNQVGGVRVLVMTNGSPDRSGQVVRYAETVPVTITDPVEAAAWQYGCPVEVYRQLRRRT